MMRRSTWMTFAAIVFGLFICQASVWGAQVTVSGKPVPLPVHASLEGETAAAPVQEEAQDSSDETGEPSEDAAETLEPAAETMEETTVVRLKKFKVFGLASPDMVAISYNDDTIGYVERTQFQMLLPKISLDELPDISPYSTLTVGSRGSEVSSMQLQLIDLEILTGAADGVYGNGTAGAVRRFQEENGLEATGTADPLTRLFIGGRATKTLNKKIKTEYPAVFSVEDKFSSIMDDVTESLEPFVTPEWIFSFDKFTGLGAIDLGVPAGTPAVESPAVDRIVLETAFKVIVAKNKAEGTIDIIPAMTIDSTGACRPYVESVFFSEGSDICEITDAVYSGGLDGITLYENAYVPLTKEAAEFLTSHENISVRINGRNNDYDYSMGVDRDSLAAFLTAVDGYLE